MRLTLRTLLAYVDNILDPQDRDLLEKKVQESEFAQNLIRRSRDAVNDQELSASEPIGHGLRQDPNLVAEYLDNTMAREQIEEFERQCLDMSSDADTRLAEITACHHILTMVLGEPLQFSASSRERMYGVGEDGSTPATENREQGDWSKENIDSTIAQEEKISEGQSQPQDRISTTSGVALDAEDLAYESQIPDYLREEEKRSRWLPIVATALVAAVVTGLLLILVGSGSSGRQGTKTVTQANQSTDVSGQIPTENQSSLSESSESTPLPTATATEDAKPASPTVISREEESVNLEEKSSAAAPPAAVTNVAPTNTTESTAASATTEAKGIPSESATVPPNTDSRASEVSSEKPENDPLPGDGIKQTEIAGEKKDEVPSSNQVLGRLISDDQILLASRAGFDELRMLPPHSNLEIGHKLLALPTFRPNLVMIALTVELEGGSLLELLDLSDGGIPTVQLSYGQMVVRTNRNGGMFRLKLNDTRSVEVTLQSTETTVGIEVNPQQRPGYDPEATEKVVTVDLYVMTGTASWQEKSLQGTIEAKQHQNLTQLPPPGPESFVVAPGWMTKAQMGKLESRAVPALRDAVQADRSVKLSFLELIQKRRQVEVKQLALRCCAYIGYFDPLVQALGDEKMDRRWGKCVMYLRDAVGRHPEYAMRVRESMENLHSEKGFDLYRMLWGYSNEGLVNNGEAAQLVDFLSSEDLEYRVLSHWNLNDITGKGYSFQPNKPEQQRRKSLKRWQALLSKGDIKHSEQK